MSKVYLAFAAMHMDGLRRSLRGIDLASVFWDPSMAVLAFG